jgi:hypothetical protein
MIPKAHEKYDLPNEQQFREDIRRKDDENFKRGRDVRLENGERLILRSPNGTQFSITVSNAGIISAVTI